MSRKDAVTTPKIVAPKKLIEVALPLDDINKACAREKSIRHGHPSTLHLWWARRPLAAARAVLFAQLVNDPSWRYSAAELKTPRIRSVVTRRRNELFRIVSELVIWENSTSEAVLQRARTEIAASWKETCEANRLHPEAARLFDPNCPPAFHDPFAGGGSIPLEAQRLGLRAHGSDLNPVAVLINKGMIEIPPRFVGREPVGPLPASEKQTRARAAESWPGAMGLAEDVRRYGQFVRNLAERHLSNLYPKVRVVSELAKGRPDLERYLGQELTVVAWLWARTVASPSPAFSGAPVPLCTTFMVSTKAGKEFYVEPIVAGGTYKFEVRAGKPADSKAKAGTSAGKWSAFRCLLSGAPISYDYIRSEGMAGRLGTRLMAVVAEGDNSRVYLTPTKAMEEAATGAAPSWGPDLEINHHPRDIKTQIYGLLRYRDLFTSRQLVALTTFSNLVLECRERVVADALAAGWRDDGVRLAAGGSGATAYADAVATYLAFAISKLADRGSSICTWFTERDSTRNTFARQSIPMTWDFAELNTLLDGTGSFAGAVHWTAESLEGVAAAVGVPPGEATQCDAAAQSVSIGKVVSTDPPYFDNIGYADLSDFFYVWLRRTLRTVYPSLLDTIAVPKADELVATPYRHGGKGAAEAFFLSGMSRAMGAIATHSNAAYPITIFYAFRQSETDATGTGSTGWESFLQAVLAAGLAVVGTWPVRTELANRMIGAGSNALASSVVLVCRKRAADADSVSRKAFVRELSVVLPAAIDEMTADAAASIAPVDLAQACIGPGMAAFSRHSVVLEADGTPMSVRSALVYINRAIDDYFSHAEGDLDADTRFSLAWFEQFGFETGAFGEADVLARAKGTSVDGVKESGVLEAGKGKVRLYRIKELPKGWDPSTDTRTPVWEACHQLCRALAESEGEAGALLARMPEKQEPVRLLAYRLYTLCERKGWAEEARAYNELVTSWPAIVEASQRAENLRKQQLDLL